MSIEIAISPSGRLRLEGAENIFADGNGAGLFQLLLGSLPLEAGASCNFFYRIVREYAMQLCRQTAGNDEQADCDPFEASLPNQTMIDSWLFERPPLTGGEYLNRDRLNQYMVQLAEYARQEHVASKQPLVEWLRKLNPAWRDVGKVSFHLAENKNDPDGNHPFLFLATFIHRISENDRPKHLPLALALKNYANDRNTLLSMLRPISAVTKQSKLIASMMNNKTIFQTCAWSVRDAFTFLSDIPIFESANIVVMTSRIWQRQPPKVQVQISLRTVEKQSFFSGHGLLDFSIDAVLGDETISPEGLKSLLESGEQLVRLKGEWVEIDSKKVKQVLDQWQHVQEENAGISIRDAMRLLAEGGVPGKSILPDVEHGICRVKLATDLEKMLKDATVPERIQLPSLPQHLRKILRPYQLDGVKFLWGLTRIGMGPCLADDMGLGKTLQVLVYLELLRRDGVLDELPALLVLPASLLNNWRSEAQKFTPDLKVKLLHPSLLAPSELQHFRNDPAGFLRRYELVVTTYALSARYTELSKLEFPLVIADEAQMLKNPTTHQSRAVRALKASRRIALTGTPVENRLTDLWSIFDFTNPGLLGKLSEFLDFTRKKIQDELPENLAPLRRLTGFYILRRLKSDKSIIQDLPDKVEVNNFCRLSKKQAAMYQAVVDNMRKALQSKDTNGIQRKGIVLKSLLQFKQICNHPNQYNSNLGEFKTEESGKFQMLVELAEQIMAMQEKVLVFTQFREMTEPLHELLSQVFGRRGLILHGNVPVKKRASMVDAFQNEEGPPFFVLSLKAAGLGLNLTAAKHVIHFDRWWNPAVENQATDRAYRIGQHSNVMVHKFICSGTVEEKIDQLINSKRKLAEAVVDSAGEVSLTELGTDELLDLVKLDINQLEV